MTYNPHQGNLREIAKYFTDNSDLFPGVAENLEHFLAEPTLTTARDLMGSYFRLHRKDDVESLRLITSTFADKKLVMSIVDSIIDDEQALQEIAGRSYPHPIGFDKLVLYDDKATGFKFRLHIYWRGNQRAAMERTHLHRFEMASAIVTGELTNHTWRVARYQAENDLLPFMDIPALGDNSEQERKTMFAYSGYWRDGEGKLHKKILGECDLVRGSTETFASGHSYAQILSDAHYVETNAETGTSNGDICSTIYVHSGGLKDESGRGIPILFEDFRLAADDQIIETIPEIKIEKLKESLTRYRDFLAQGLEFYEWLYDPKHGRDLSVGMMSGYLFSENQHSPHTLSLWIDHNKAGTEMLDECSTILAKLVNGEMELADLSDDDRSKRYYALLLEKADRYEGGKDEWLKLNGDLTKEMWRYCGALKGEKPQVTVLKPLWENVVGKKMPGGAHYGHIAAMIEAAFEANEVAQKYFKSGMETEYKADGSPASDADREIEQLIRDKLHEYYPAYAFTGEEGGSNGSIPQEGSHRWLVDPIDGTRNFLAGRDDFCVSIACQILKDGEWQTTDGVISIPVSGKIFWAEKDHGAYIIERDDLERSLDLSTVSKDNSLKNKMVDISLSGFGIESEANIVKALRSEKAVYRATGSAALMLAMVANKSSDGVILTANDYDIAAAQLIADEAGASLSHFDFVRGGHEFRATIAGVTEQVHDSLRDVAFSNVSDFIKTPRPRGETLEFF